MTVILSAKMHYVAVSFTGNTTLRVRFELTRCYAPLVITYLFPFKGARTSRPAP